MASTYTWAAGSGLWDVGANWIDTTTPGAGTAPGAADTATINSDTISPDVIYGPASAATLDATGFVAFAGNAAFGLLSDAGQQYGPPLRVLSGGTVSAGSADLTAFVEIAGPGARLTVAGAAITSSTTEIELFDHASFSAASLVSPMGSDLTLSVDPTSTAEIGGGSIATAGTLAIDAGTTLTLGGFTRVLTPTLVQGTVADTQDLFFYAAVTGAGTIAIGAGATLNLYSTAAAGLTIDFASTSGTLYLASSANELSDGAAQPGPNPVVSATIAGFSIGDAILTAEVGVTGATYTQTGNGIGEVDFLAGSTVVQRLTLSGNFAGETFVFTPYDSQRAGALTLTAGQITPAVAAVTNPGSDAYGWTTAAGGSWATAANWTDANTGTTATTAPGATNAVTITGPTDISSTAGQSVALIDGNGNAASLTVIGTIELAGNFGIGTLAVGVYDASPFIYEPATVTVTAGSTLTANVAQINSAVNVAGGLLSATTLAVGDGGLLGLLYAYNGGRVVAGGLTLSGFGTVGVDATSSVAIGAAAAAGTITIGAGITVGDTDGIFDGPVRNDGLISAGGGIGSEDLFTGPISGSGTITVQQSSNLLLQGAVAATQTIGFAGNGRLTLTAASTEQGRIVNVDTTDVIMVADAVASVAYAATGPNAGTLTLRDASGTTVGSLAVSGSLDGNSFVLLPAASIFETAQSADTEIVLAQGTLLNGPLPAPAPDTHPAQTFTQVQGGDWGTGTTWGTTDAPGTLDTVVLGSAANGYTVLSGQGYAAAVTANTNGTGLSGVFGFGTLTVADGTSRAGWLAVTANSTLTAGTASVTSGVLDVAAAGASLDVTGTLALMNGSLVLADGGRAQIAALSIGGTGVSTITLAVDASSALEVGTLGGAAAGLLTVDAGQTVHATTFGGLYVLASVRNDGTIDDAASFGTIDGNVTGNGTIIVEAGANLIISGQVGAGETVEFVGTGGTLSLSQTTPLTIAGFALGDTLLVNGTETAAQYTSTGAGTGTLTLTEAGSAVAIVTLLGSYAGDIFVASPTVDQQVEAVTNSSVVLAAACFAEGTRIATDHGPVAIERLRVGDRVRTAWGELRPVEWIGRRRTDCRKHPAPHDVWPVRVAPHAFGPGRPERELFLSPDHAVHVGELDGPDLLVPVRYLINDATIVQVPVEAVTYWHIELPDHDVVMAEGLACESYLDTGNRSAFENCGDAVMLHPDFSRAVWDERACATLTLGGPDLAVVRSLLHARAVESGHTLTRDAALQVVAGGFELPWDGAGRVVLPAGTDRVRLVSRTVVPGHVRIADPDHRRLGVAVAKLALDGIGIPLDDARLSAGWHAPEPGWRWTDGSADFVTGGARCLTIGTLAFADYWVEPLTSIRSTPSLSINARSAGDTATQPSVGARSRAAM